MNKTQLPNCLTLLRMAGSVILCLVPVFSWGFYGVYLLCGVTDMLDGALARRLQAESRTGEVLDSLADAFFVLVCLVRLLPHLRLPSWLWIWVGLIALIKLFTLAVGAFRDHRFAFLHTAAKKLTGLLLFLFPLALPWLGIVVPGTALCCLATFAAVQELARTIRSKEMTS